VKFQPSEHSYGDYGWSSSFPLSVLTVSATAKARGLNNQPGSSAHKANLSRLSNFLGKLPFKFRINSGYRSPALNTAIHGSTTSQHPNGLAVDASPIGVSNKAVATWLYENRDKFPELDQVIWYTDTSHVHIGICPSGATNCPRSKGARGEFYMARKEGSAYIPWAPTAAEAAKMAALYAYHRPGKTLLVVWGLSLVGSAGVLGLLYVINKKVEAKKAAEGRE